MTAMGAKDQKQGADEVLASGEYPLTRRDLTEIAAMIYSDAGIFLNETKASLVYSRLSKHIRNLGLSGFREYCALVASPAGAQPRREMLSHLTTNFTRFFRENHHFDHRAESDHAVSGVALRFGGEQQQRWTDALATAFAQVFGDFRNGLHGGNGIVAELALNRAQVIVEQIEDLFCRRYGRCTYSYSAGNSGPA